MEKIKGKYFVLLFFSHLDLHILDLSQVDLKTHTCNVRYMSGTSLCDRVEKTPSFSEAVSCDKWAAHALWTGLSGLTTWL